MTNLRNPRLPTLCLLVSLGMPFFLTACDRTSPKEDSSRSGGQAGKAAAAATPSTIPDSPPTGKSAPRRELSLVSVSSGAFLERVPTEAYGHSALELLDERPITAWRSADGAAGPHVFVLVLPEQTSLKTLEFDCSSDFYRREGSCAKDISVEVSDVSEAAGFKKIADLTLREGADNQMFPVSASVPGRWVRLTLINNHGSKESCQLNDFRATGTQLTHTAFPDISGTYQAKLGQVHLKQEGMSVSGCYSYLGRADNVLSGGIEGRMIKLAYCQYCSEPSRVRKTGVFVFAPNGQKFVGLTWDESGTFGDYAGDHWEGTKISFDVGKCGQSAGGAEGQLTKDLEEFGRTRVYGINFDTDSDHIKDESKPTLDKIANILKTKADWKITIEGHTDSTSTPQHNQDLSERRAISVKSYLQAAGIAETRLKTAAYGAAKPAASNDTELGRAQNRRVELVRQ